MAKSYQKWVTDLVVHVKRELNLSEWRVGLDFDVHDQEHNEFCVAFVIADHRYLTAHVCFTPLARQFFKDQNYFVLAECVVHELCHLLLKPLEALARQGTSPQTESQLTDILEQTTQRLARIVAAKIPQNVIKV